MKQNQNTIAAMHDHPRAIRIKFHDHSWLFHQSLKKLVVVETLFWQLGARFIGRCRCRYKSRCMDCPVGQKRNLTLTLKPKTASLHPTPPPPPLPTKIPCEGSVKSMVNEKKIIHFRKLYKIKCCHCQVTYIGVTGRNLSARLNEHRRVTRNGDINNHITEHHLQTKHRIVQITVNKSL